MIEFLEAEAGIRQLHAHYTDAVWRRDPVAFAECFTRDAEWRISGMVLRGHDEIAGGFGTILAKCNRVLISFRNPQVDLTGRGRASARVYVTEQCSWTDRAPNMNLGRYHDRAVLDGDRWRFEWRLFQLLYTGPADLTGAFQDQPDYGAWPAMPRRDAVPAPTPGRD
ncbi:uncharacterized protein (TIGR02246 family) [Novosphingobium chloroacetimidivorans]|uniref:Uncharacterized protein (TIGR02246 family) n=1 Tax=Novosphingobium chloroacetimidivorans TaxID=1428314 RepID=A0A7W7K786_9SPHN|nr:nuclear transport factor 2 family protein [Novosphingobium chloroacetimidivorans]MBB4857515.1 uncharacterized protein (TIGR02246 family) [Novosphingobium chloroacetimidivorans]